MGRRETVKINLLAALEYGLLVHKNKSIGVCVTILKGTPTKRQVSKRLVSKRPVSKR
jgi:hypothetical protein